MGGEVPNLHLLSLYKMDALKLECHCRAHSIGHGDRAGPIHICSPSKVTLRPGAYPVELSILRKSTMDSKVPLKVFALTAQSFPMFRAGPIHICSQARGHCGQVPTPLS